MLKYPINVIIISVDQKCHYKTSKLEVREKSIKKKIDYFLFIYFNGKIDNDCRDGQ